MRAAQQLRAEGVRARFTVVGPDEGELAAVEAALQAAPDPDGLVTYGGVVPMDASAQRMADADVFVLPSVDEPFPMALAEAMAQGMPVVCTRSNGLAPYVVEGDAGIVVPDDDHDALVAALRELVADTDGARRRGRNGAAVVRDRLSIAAVASRLEELYGSDAAQLSGAVPRPGGRVPRRAASCSTRSSPAPPTCSPSCSWPVPWTPTASAGSPWRTRSSWPRSA